MKRIAVIGCCGSGKTTFSRALHDCSGLPLIHLDKVFWSENWTLPDIDTFRRQVSEIHSQEKWIIDGNYHSTLAERVEKADAVVFLDHWTPVCFWRVIRRIATGYGKNRPDVADGCPERIDLPFLRYVLSFRRKKRPQIAELLGTAPDGRVFHARNSKEAAAVLEVLRARLQKLDITR